MDFSTYALAVMLMVSVLARRRQGLFRGKTSAGNTLGQLAPDVVKSLKLGANLLSIDRADGESVPLIVYKDDDNNFHVCRNRCCHQGGKFAVDVEDSSILTCTRHHWKLDPRTRKYIAPASTDFEQAKLPISLRHDGSCIVYDDSNEEAWEAGIGPKQPLVEGEANITFLAHACIEIRLGGVAIVTDPWLLGPAFTRGWWLSMEPPPDALQRVAAADAIYISHAHPDHMNIPTLKEVVKLNPHVPIYVGKLSVPVWKGEVASLGFTNVCEVELKTWIPVGKAKMMILPDNLLPYLDTGLLVEYKGHTVLNLVDCSNPNGYKLPTNVDVLLTDFASGASGFPSLFSDAYGEKKVLELAQRKATNFLRKVAEEVAVTKPSVWIPFAGYFVEACPGDELVRRLNKKNSPTGAEHDLKKSHPNLHSWLPFPGGSYDLATKVGQIPPRSIESYQKTQWDFEPYIFDLRKSLEFKPLQTMTGVYTYFRWAGFSDYDMVLHMIETTDDFSEELRSYIVDFKGVKPQFLDSVPTGRPVLKVRARASVLRDTLIKGQSWDSLYIGFSAHYHPTPDTYHMRFFDHFGNNKLPLMPPQF